MVLVNTPKRENATKYIELLEKKIQTLIMLLYLDPYQKHNIRAEQLPNKLV